MKIEDSDKIQLSGVVVPICWDELGRVTTVQISAHGELDFRVAAGGAGDGLIELCGSFVEVRAEWNSDDQLRILEVRVISSLMD